MLSKLVAGVVASISSFALAFEVVGVEPPRPGAVGQSIGSRRALSSVRDITVRLPDGPNLRVRGRLAGLIAEGHSAYRSKQYDRAISSFTAALKSNPDRDITFFIYFSRACAYSEKGQLDKALSDWTAAIQLNSKSATVWYNRGHDYGVIGDTDKAISDYTAAIQLNPRYLIAYVNRGNKYSEKRSYKLGIRDATMAIQLNPKHANAYHNRGAYYAETGEFDKAIADLTEAIRLNPKIATTFYGRATTYEDIEKFDKAIADYDRVVRIAPNDSDDYAARGRAYFKKGNYEEAASAFQKALQLSPSNDFALGGLAWLKATCPDASLRDGKESIRMSTRACELSKWSEQDHLQALAAAYAESGDFDQAVKYQTQAIKMKSAYGPVDKETREHLALYQAHKPARSKPLVAR
jgi:tetratricopeptide (TPR) repeat protein